MSCPSHRCPFLLFEGCVLIYLREQNGEHAFDLSFSQTVLSEKFRHASSENRAARSAVCVPWFDAFGCCLLPVFALALHYIYLNVETRAKVLAIPSPSSSTLSPTPADRIDTLSAHRSETALHKISH